MLLSLYGSVCTNTVVYFAIIDRSNNRRYTKKMIKLLNVNVWYDDVRIRLPHSYIKRYKG